MNERLKQQRYTECRRVMAQDVQMGCCSRKGKTGCNGCSYDLPFADWKQQYDTEQLGPVEQKSDGVVHRPE